MQSNSNIFSPGNPLNEAPEDTITYTEHDINGIVIKPPHPTDQSNQNEIQKQIQNKRIKDHQNMVNKQRAKEIERQRQNRIRFQQQQELQMQQFLQEQQQQIQIQQQEQDNKPKKQQNLNIKDIEKEEQKNEGEEKKEKNEEISILSKEILDEKYKQIDENKIQLKTQVEDVEINQVKEKQIQESSRIKINDKIIFQTENHKKLLIKDDNLEKRAQTLNKPGQKNQSKKDEKIMLNFNYKKLETCVKIQQIKGTLIGTQVQPSQYAKNKDNKFDKKK